MASSSDLARRLRIQLAEARAIYRQRGVGGVVARLRQRASGKDVQRPLKKYAFVLPQTIGEPLDAAAGRMAPPLSINWVVPPFERGAGGHTTIFRLVRRLEEAGFTCTVVVNEGHYFGMPEHFKKIIVDHYEPLKAGVVTRIEDAPPAQATFATSWTTAYPVRNFQPTQHRCYLVQDFEPWFCAVGSEYALTEATYRMGFLGVTAGTWLRDKLAADYGMRTHAFGFSFDRDVYFPPTTPRPERGNTVFFYARPATERRAFDLGLLVLAELVRRRPGTKVLFAGGDLSGYDIPFAHESAGVVSVQKLAELYRESDAALVFSVTNASLIPLESMACGTVVVSNDGPSVEWLLNRDCAVLVPPTVEDMTAALQRVLDDAGLRAGLRERGLAFARATSWEAEADKVVAVMRDLLASTPGPADGGEPRLTAALAPLSGQATAAAPTNPPHLASPRAATADSVG
jgi:glycosyltransferase involved in cell wall biosynthesis